MSRSTGLSDRICFYFVKHGNCKFGDACRYSHDISDPEQAAQTLEAANKNKPRESNRGEICRHFQRGACKFGDKCCFEHIKEQDLETNACRSTSNAPIENAQGIFNVLVKRQMANSTEKQVELFLRVIQTIIKEEDGTMKSIVLEVFGGQEGVAILRNLFGGPKTFTVGNAATNAQVSLSTTFLPFLKIATSKDVISNPLQHLVNSFLQALATSFNWTSLGVVLSQCTFTRSTPSYSRLSQHSPETYPKRDLPDLLQTLLTFVLELLNRFDTTFLSNLELIAQTISKLHEVVEHEPLSSRMRNQISKDYSEFASALSQKTEIKLVRECLAKFLKDQSAAKAAKQVKRVNRESGIAKYADPPGTARANGPRHDNDYEDIRLISIAPTESEVLCEIPPYLPPNRAGTVAHLPEGSTEGHRDLHFRLLRFNLIAEIQDSILKFIKRGGVQDLAKQDAEAARGKALFPDLKMDMYRNVTLSGITASKNIGISYMISFDQLETLKNKSNRDIFSFWRKTKRLVYGTLVCLLWHENNCERPTIVFGAVTERDEKLLSSDRPALGLRTLPNAYCEKLAALIVQDTDHVMHRSEIVLIQAGPSFFAYEPVLKALKTAPIPLAHLITKPPIEKEVPQTSIFSFLARSSATEIERKETPLPLYAEEGGTFDLGFLSLDPSRRKLPCFRVDSASPNRFPLAELERFTSLDKFQAQALKAALTQEIAVIQGPPGTGKTYVCIQIVRSLLTFQPRQLWNFPDEIASKGPTLCPILCVCYTNHALDQFLVGLLEAGVENIVRVGGNCKNERLAELNLKNLDKPNLGRRGYEIRKELLPALEEKIANVNGALQRNTEQTVAWQSIEQYVLATSPSFVTFLERIITDFEWEESTNASSEALLSEAWNWWCALGQSAPRFLHRFVGARTAEQLLDLDRFDDISQYEHKTLYDYWTSSIVDMSKSEVQRLMGEYEKLLKEYSELQTKSNLACLKKASIVGMTTTYVAKHQNLLECLMPKIVILEEAAEVLEAHVLTCLSRHTQQLIMIGDHLQLRPKVDNYLLQAESGSGFDLDVSLFERLITQNDTHYVTLRSQRRMRPQFSQLIRRTLYPNLTDHESVLKFPEIVQGMRKTLFFFDHDHAERGQHDGKSKSNVFEAQFAVHLSLYLMKQGCFKTDDVAIITTYVGQLQEIRRLMSKLSLSIKINDKDNELLTEFLDKKDQETETDDTARKDDIIGSAISADYRINAELDKCVRLATVDNFQGEEAKVIILSLVRNQKEGHIGFVGIENRINVMLSRAREGMYILGNAQSLEACKKTNMWRNILKMIRAQDLIGDAIELQCQRHWQYLTQISHWNEFQLKAGGGGCQRPCAEQRPCGHICKKMCHAEDAEHLKNDCTTPIDVKLPCGHVKTNVPCHQAADKSRLLCQELVTVRPLHCRYQHEHQVRCHAAKKFSNDPKSCTTLVDVRMPFCGHQFQTKCCQEDAVLSNPSRCMETCGRIVGNCGHPCQRKCGSCIKRSLKSYQDFQFCSTNQDLLDHGECESRCGKRLSCGHDCTMKCHEGKENCGPCNERCSIVCTHRVHGCSKKCSDPCVPCAEVCEWECEHRGKCRLLCGVPCDRLPCDQRCSKTLSCGCRCPSVCGEPCPKSAYCLTHASEDVKKMNVDIIMFRTYEEITDEELNQDPLIVLNCGHAYLMSTLDGHMEMTKFYDKDPNGEWIKPSVSCFESFVERKCCMVCRKPITDINRYGRVIRKTSVDFMERAFYQRFESALSKALSSIDGLAQKSDSIAQMPKSGNREVRFAAINALLIKVKREADFMLKLMLDCQVTPVGTIHEQMQARIYGLEQREEIRPEDVKYIFDSWIVHNPDLVRPCKCYVGYGRCMKLWFRLLCLAFEAIEQTRSHPNARQEGDLKRLTQSGIDTIEAVSGNVMDAIDMAIKSMSSTRIVDTCQWAVQVYVESLKFSLQTNNASVAVALAKDLGSHNQQTRALQESILQRATDILRQGREACNNEQQHQKLKELSDKVERMRGITSDIPIKLQMALIKTVLIADPNIRGSHGREHIFRCPNGHYYLIGECGGAMQRSTCLECGAAIGGVHHNLDSGNSAIDANAQRYLH